MPRTLSTWRLDELAGIRPAAIALIRDDDPEATVPDIGDLHVYVFSDDLGDVRELLRVLALRVLAAERELRAMQAAQKATA